MVSSRLRDSAGVIVGVILVVILLIAIAVISAAVIFCTRKKTIASKRNGPPSTLTEEHETFTVNPSYTHTTTSRPSTINSGSYALTSSSVEGSSSEPFIQLTVNEAYTTAIVLNDNLAYGAKKQHQINGAVNLPVEIYLETGSSQDRQADEMTYDYI